MRIWETMRNQKKVLSNFSYLTILEIFILLAPLITYPYLVRVLGKELYGWIITAQITASYCTILIDFGFKRISARHIANNCNDKIKVGEIISSILILRLFLCILSFIIYFVVILIIPIYRQQLPLFMFSFLTTLSSVVFLDFYFQGIEEMKYITIINIIVRSIFIFATFLFITSKHDYIYVPLLWGIGYIVGGATSLWVVFVKNKISFYFPTLKLLKAHLKEGAIIFFSDAMLTIKDKLNYNLMGGMIGMSDVVIYDVGSKICGILQKPASILCTVFFPKMAKNPSILQAKKGMLLLFLVSLILVIITNIFLPFIVKLFIGQDCDLGAIRLYSIAPIFLSVSVFISINIFFVFKLEKYVFNSTLITTIGYVVLLAAMYFGGLLNSVYSFVLLTLAAYIIEFIYRFCICRNIFHTYKTI